LTTLDVGCAGRCDYAARRRLFIVHVDSGKENDFPQVNGVRSGRRLAG